MLIRLPSLSEPRWHPDDGLFTVVAWATSKGVPLYAGVYDNSPDGRLLILGDQPWLYLDTGLLPATPYPATNSAFWRSSGAAAETRQALRKGRAQVVVYSDGPGYWLTDLEAGGYQPVEGAPWPTFQAKERGPAC